MQNSSVVSNIIKSDNSILSQVMLWSLFGLSFPGFTFNMIVSIISFHSDIKGVYKWFILHLSIIDMVYSLSNIAHASFMLFPSAYDRIFCHISAIVHWSCILLSLVALLPLTFHRLCSLRYENLFNLISTKVGIALLIFICDMFVFLIIIPYPTIFSRVVRSSRGFSCDFEPPEDLKAILYGAFVLLETPVMFGILIYNNLHIIWIVHKGKENNVRDLNHEIRLKETKALVRAIILQATIPTLVQLPLLATTAVYVAGGSVNPDWDTFTAFVHSINPIANAFVTFIVVRPYRRALRKRFGIVSPDETQIGKIERVKTSNFSRTKSVIDKRNSDLENSTMSRRRLPSVSS